MSSLYALQTSFNRGEISPLLATRADIDFWRTSLAYCRNFQVLTHGGLRRRSGSRYIATVKDSSEVCRLFPFKFSESQSYILVLNDGVIRFCALRGVLGAPYEISHPWAAADLARLSYAQFNDIAYFAHKDYAPEKLTRSGDTDWALADVVFDDGPYLPIDVSSPTILTPAATGAVHPAMTSATAPSGTVAQSAGTGWQAFDRSKTTAWAIGAADGYLSYDFAGATTKVCDAYWIKARANGNPKAPVAWEFQGFDGTNWITIDARQSETGWSRGEVRFYEFENETAYQSYRFLTSGSEDDADTIIAETGWHESGDTQTPFNLTASAVTGINDDQGFLASDVGRTIRLKGTDSKWRWARIAARTSSTVVTVRLYGHSLPDLSPIANWQMGAWSDESGWPGSVALYDERLMWGRTDEQPVTVWGSKQGEFEDYGVSDPLVGTDGINITLLSSNMNEIIWIADDEDIVTGSAGQIRTVGPSDITQSFSATNITQRKGPTSGAHYLQPLSIGGVVLYVGEGGTKIRELVLGDQNRYVAPELTVLAEHMFKSGIVDWAFSEKPDPTIWAVTGDGLLVSITYDREQKVLGFARHDFGGTVENVAVISGTETGYDDVYLIVKRTINGSVVRYVEVLERPFDGDTDDVEDAFFVDCGLTYDGAAITTVTGLSHLEGEEVKVLADGSVVSGLTVSGGEIELPGEASVIHVGLEYTSRAITLPVSGPTQDGTLFGRRKNIIAGYVDTLHTGHLKVGAYSGNDDWTPPLTNQIHPLYDALLPDGWGLFGNAVYLRSNFTRCDIDGSWAEGQGQVVMETSEPLPCIIRSFVFQIEGEP